MDLKAWGVKSFAVGKVTQPDRGIAVQFTVQTDDGSERTMKPVWMQHGLAKKFLAELAETIAELERRDPESRQ